MGTRAGRVGVGEGEGRARISCGTSVFVVVIEIGEEREGGPRRDRHTERERERERGKPRFHYGYGNRRWRPNEEPRRCNGADLSHRFCEECERDPTIGAITLDLYGVRPDQPRANATGNATGKLQGVVHIIKSTVIRYLQPSEI